MPKRASTAFGLTAYNGADHIAEALESLLCQTRGDLAIVVADDCSTDRTNEIALRYAELDSRVVYVRNDRQLGLARNWRHAFDLACERFPEAEYFAWASDHDVWQPRWLEALAAELDANPDAVLAYPLGTRIDDLGAEYPTRPHLFATDGMSDPTARLRLVARELTSAGEMIYGLTRRAALERCGPFPLALLPDRLQLVRLAVEGEFLQVEQRLWYRRHRAGVVMSNRRQRRASFPAGVPLWAYLPWWLTHAGLFARSLGGRPSRLRLSGMFLASSLRHAGERRRERVRRERRWRRREQRRRLRSLVRSARQRLGLRARPAENNQRAQRATTVEAKQGAESPSVREALAAMEQAGLVEELAVPGAVLLEIGAGSAALGNELSARLPELVCAVLPPEEIGRTDTLGRVDLAVSIVGLERLAGEELASCLERLHELGTRAIYSVDRGSDDLRGALARWFWLHELWVPSRWPEGRRKPDPSTGAVLRRPGTDVHVVGRRRLLPDRVPVPDPK